MLIPVEVEVDSEARPLLVVLRPVDSEVTPLWAVLIPVEVDVDSEVTLLFVVLRPVESDATPLCAVFTPVDKELTLVDVVVDSEVNWPKLTASVGFTPAATLVSVTGVVEPTPPSVTFVWVESSY